GYSLSRVGDPRAIEYFSKAVELYEKKDFGPISSATTANLSQAMSHAYLAIGKTDRAIESLERALTLAKKATRSVIFSSITYREATVSQFVEETQFLLRKARQARKAN